MSRSRQHRYEHTILKSYLAPVLAFVIIMLAPALGISGKDAEGWSVKNFPCFAI